MSIEVRLYGELKSIASLNKTKEGQPVVQKLDSREIGRVDDVFQTLDINEEEISHVFINGKYLGKYSKGLFDEDRFLGKSMDEKVGDGDRVAIFPKNMSMVIC